MVGRLALGLVLGLGLLAPAAAQDSPWPAEARTPSEDAPTAPSTAPASEAVAVPTPVVEVPAAQASTAVVAAQPLFFSDLTGTARYALLVFVLLAAYLLPALLYPTVLSATTLSPGRAAGLCVAGGALFIAFPGVLAVFAQRAFSAGVAVPWYRQLDHLPLAAGGAGGLLILAVLAWRTRGTRADA